MSNNKHTTTKPSEPNQLDDDVYQMPVEQETDAIDDIVNKQLPTDINKWFFVVIISGISAIFGILMKLQDDRLAYVSKNALDWRSAYYNEVKAKDALQKYYNENKDCAERVQNAKELLSMFDVKTKNSVKIDSLKQILK